MSHSSSSSPARPWRSAVLLSAALVGLAAFATACRASSNAASGPAATSTSTRPGTANRAKYVACLEDHGVPSSVATSGLDGSGRDPVASGASPSATTVDPIRPEYSAAFNACRSDLPTRFGSGGFQDSAAVRAYMNCLQAHGVVPDPPPTTGPGQAPPRGGQGGFESIAQSPTFKAAANACAPLRPRFGGSTTSTTT